MRRWMILAALVVATASVVASAAVPNIFVAGQPANAQQVNQNFAYLDGRTSAAIGALVVSKINISSGSTTSVASAACPANTIVQSANCGCSDAGGTRNYGTLFSCEIAGNGGVVGCFKDALTADAGKPVPRGDITVVCLGGEQVDGTPLFVTVGAKPDEKLEAKVAELRAVEQERMGR